MNILEVFADAVKPFLDGKKPPLNVGEVMNLWFYLTATEQTLIGEQVSFNTTQDSELQEKLQDVITNVHRPILEEIKTFLQSEGVPLDPPPAQVPVGDFRSIPAGSKMTDEQMASMLSFNIVLGIQYACRGMTEAVRPDVASMFVRFQIKKMTFAIQLREMMLRKGWLKAPPAYLTAVSDADK